MQLATPCAAPPTHPPTHPPLLSHLLPLPQVPDLSWADLIQLGSVVAIKEAGGPFIPLRLGRLDATEAGCTPGGVG